MLRTTFSCIALFGSLLLVGRLLQEGRAQEGPSFRQQLNTSTADAPALTMSGPALGQPRVAQRDDEDEAAQFAPPSRVRRPAESVVSPFHRTDIDSIRLPLETDEGVGAGEVIVPIDDLSPQQPQTPGEAPTTGEDLSAEMISLRDNIRSILDYHYARPVNTAERSPWAVMHAAIAFGVDSQVYAGTRRVNAIGWLSWNGNCAGQRLLYTSGESPRAMQGPGVQGHQGQFLAILAQSRVRDDYVLRVDGREFTVADLVQSEKLTCQAGTELTFKLIGLVHYLESDATWKNERGETWDIPRLIQEELKQPVIGAACGGTHRMMGFSYAVRKREKRGEPMDGQWLRAKKYVDAYHDYTLKLQNPDGSFSTNWFAGRGDWGDAPRRLETSGHILEWLVYSLPEERLREPEVVKGVEFLTSLLSSQRGSPWEIGPLGHALHGLVLYDERVFGTTPGSRNVQLAREPGKRVSD